MRSLLPIAVLVTACAGGNDRKEAEAVGVRTQPPADSLVLRMPDSAEVWLAGFMLDTTVSGEPCVERTVEIRHANRRTPVPLLYVLGGVEPVDDTTVRADLVRDCAKYDTYLVNTKTGQPRRAE